MITKAELVKCNFTVLDKGGWIYIDPIIIPNDWDDICSDFGIDPKAKGAFLAIAGVKEDSNVDS